MRIEDIHVGNRVRFRQWDDMAAECGLHSSGNIMTHYVFTAEMRYLCGQEFVVADAIGPRIDLEDHPLYYMISADMLEPVSTWMDEPFDQSDMSVDALF
jgi:hypothetical protein